MAGDSGLKIVIRHVSGAKANKTDEFDVSSRDEIQLGRAFGNDVIYDSPRDGAVSRSHASVQIVSREPLRFALEDKNSANGTFIGAERVSGKIELLPEDKISLGPNGPSFIFDVRPRPADLKARTVIIRVGSPAETRVLDAAESMTAASTVIDQNVGSTRETGSSTTSNRTTGSNRRNDAPPPLDASGKKPIGEETLIRKIKEARTSANSLWLKFAGALAAILVLGGSAGLYWLYTRETSTEQSQQASMTRMKEALEQAQDESRRAAQAAISEKEERGKSPLEIANMYGPATAKIVVNWRLFDKDTGRPIFQKVIKVNGENYRAYVKFGDYVAPYLTLEDDGRRNYPIGETVQGTGFAVNAQGFILTNKHLAAGWRVPYFGNNFDERKGVLLEWVQSVRNGKRKWSTQQTVIDIEDEKYRSEFQSVRNWIPQTAGIIFSSEAPWPLGSINIADPKKIKSDENSRVFFAHNESMEVFFAGQKDPMAGSLERFSNEADVALIKVAAAQPLQRTVEIAKEADDDKVSAGEKVVVLGYPTVAAKTYAYAPVIEAGAYKTREEEIPKPYVTDGTIALLSTRMGAAPDRTNANVMVAGEMGDIIQLTINSTGSGNSGGPVFNSSGAVIGLFTYRRSAGGASASLAVPIKYGRALLNSQ